MLNYAPESLELHHKAVKRLVPADRLYFFDARDCWEPLYKILNCPIPDEPFSHVNDRDLQGAEQLERKVRWRGLDFSRRWERRLPLGMLVLWEANNCRYYVCRCFLYRQAFACVALHAVHCIS